MTGIDEAPSDTVGHVVILIPNFNDWSSISHVIAAIDASIEPFSAQVLVVNDASTEAPDPLRHMNRLTTVLPVEVLDLKRNIGHQRAIAIGLAYIESRFDFRAVVVMDGDGEDDPEDVPRLLHELNASGCTAAVFAERRKRSESSLFRVGYAIYRLVHRLLTGVPVKIGNFSALPRHLVSRLVLSSDLWNHYAAATVRSGFSIRTVPTTRLRRLSGSSTMNLVSLVVHGMSAIVVFGDRVAVRLLAFVSAFAAFLTSALAVLVGVHVFTDWNVEWTHPALVTTLWGVFNGIVALIVLVFVVLRSRDQIGFIPARDHTIFVDDIWTVLK